MASCALSLCRTNVSKFDLYKFLFLAQKGLNEIYKDFLSLVRNNEGQDVVDVS